MAQLAGWICTVFGTYVILTRVSGCITQNVIDPVGMAILETLGF